MYSKFVYEKYRINKRAKEKDITKPFLPSDMLSENIKKVKENGNIKYHKSNISTFLLSIKEFKESILKWWWEIKKKISVKIKTICNLLIPLYEYLSSKIPNIDKVNTIRIMANISRSRP